MTNMRYVTTTQACTCFEALSLWIKSTHDAQHFYTVKKICTWMFKYVITLSDVWKHSLVESIPHTVVGTFISTNFCKFFKAQPNWINPPHDAKYFGHTHVFSKKKCHHYSGSIPNIMLSTFCTPGDQHFWPLVFGTFWV